MLVSVTSCRCVDAMQYCCFVLYFNTNTFIMPYCDFTRGGEYRNYLLLLNNSSAVFEPEAAVVADVDVFMQDSVAC